MVLLTNLFEVERVSTVIVFLFFSYNHLVSFITAATISSFASLRTFMAVFLEHLACSITMSMFAAVRPSSGRGAPSSSTLASSLEAGMASAAGLS